ncbi:MAG: hypothetical protein JWQ95_6094 [Sphaerisporangium sp.]|jgi:hypothetical protein|nr:hypothetical protein [Sphaerisporangium sp.]
MTPVEDWVDVLGPNDVRRLPPGRAVVIVDAALPTIVRTERVWKRKDYKQWAKSGERIRLPYVEQRPAILPDPSLLLDPVAGPAFETPDELAARRRPRPVEQAEEAPPLGLPYRPAVKTDQPRPGCRYVLIWTGRMPGDRVSAAAGRPDAPLWLQLLARNENRERGATAP